MKTIHITKNQARNYMVNYHNINTTTKYNSLGGIKTFFNKVGSIQFDPLNVVGYNADLVLQSRFLNYKKELLYSALYEDRILIDGWDKQMSIYQTKDFPYFQHIRQVRANAEIHSLEKFREIDPRVLEDKILSLIKKEGPLYSKDFNYGVTKKSKWGNKKESSATLDYLFHKGTIGVRKKNNAVKQFDLIENLLSKEHLSPMELTEDDFLRWYMLRRINSIGLVWNKSGVAWSGSQLSKKAVRTTYLNKLLNDEQIVEVNIEGIKDSFYAPVNFLDYTDNLTDSISFIAPLDNLIWDRELTNKVFDFDYRWEVYTPIVKRKYGYYVLPVLYKDTFIGRIEFSKHRKNDPLEIIHYYVEKDFKDIDITIFNKALETFATYLGASKVNGMNVIKKALN